MADRRPETWEWHTGAQNGDTLYYSSYCPFCSELVWMSATILQSQLPVPMQRTMHTRRVAAINKHLAEKHPPKPEGWWPIP